MTDWKRDWNKITLQSVVGAIAAFSAAVVIVDPQHKLLAIAIASAATSAFAAASLSRFLAALRTPMKFTGLDPDDIVHSFGGASEPAVLVEGIYLGSDGKVKFSNEADAKLARTSTNVTAFITATNMRFVGPAATTLRAALGPDCAFTFQASANPALAPFMRGRIALLQLICRNDVL